ncbi:hypothetical protein PR003_g30781, partial [Phytophthora rubi]
GKINNEKATLLFDSGAEVSIVDTNFARKVGCIIGESQRQECVGIGESVYTTLGRTTIKITLAGSLVYFFDAWVGALSGQEAILGMDFMVPAGVRLDLADGTLCLPDEVRIQLSGRRPPYSRSHQVFQLDDNACLDVAKSIEVPIRRHRASERQKLWVTCGETWVPTIVGGPGRSQYLRITNLSDRKLTLQRDTRLGLWLAEDLVPRYPGFVSVGSRRYAEWQTLAYEATSDLQEEAEFDPEPSGLMVDRPKYDPPTRILKRALIAPTPAVATTTMRRSHALVHDQVESEPVGAADIKEVSRSVENKNVDQPKNDRTISHREQESDLVHVESKDDEPTELEAETIGIQEDDANPKDLEMLCNLPFPRTLRAMQSFLESLNYYSRFIEDFAVYAAILYELREVDFFELRRRESAEIGRPKTGGVEQRTEEEDRWTRATVAFTLLKEKNCIHSNHETLRPGSSSSRYSLCEQVGDLRGTRAGT